jgi:predicted hydrocarbon binding protein
VIITYASPRRLCALAKGIMAGVARHYKENLTIAETTCMHAGAAACTLVATRAE